MHDTDTDTYTYSLYERAGRDGWHFRPAYNNNGWEAVRDGIGIVQRATLADLLRFLYPDDELLDIFTPQPVPAAYGAW